MGLGFNPLYAAGLCLIVNLRACRLWRDRDPILVAGRVTRARTALKSVRWSGRRCVPDHYRAVLDYVSDYGRLARR